MIVRGVSQVKTTDTHIGNVEQGCGCYPIVGLVVKTDLW